MAKKSKSKERAPAEPAPRVEIVPAPSRVVDKISSAQAAVAQRAQDLLQDVFVESLETCQDSLAAFDLDPENPDEVPKSWKAELPDERAVKRRHRVALASLKNNKEAPVALEAARAVVQNVVRMQAKQSNVMNVKKLNVAVVVASGSGRRDYPELEIVAKSRFGGDDD